MNHDKMTQADWKSRLSEEQYRVTRQCGTERPFTGPHLHQKAAGTYTCVCCNDALFSSTAKFDSGCGWPSYTAPFSRTVLREIEDHSHGMQRIEVRCAGCDAHLGHVFNDGPPPTGLRYCINGHALNFVATST